MTECLPCVDADRNIPVWFWHVANYQRSPENDIHPDTLECLNPRAPTHDAQEWECFESSGSDWFEHSTATVRGSHDCAVVASGSDIELVVISMSLAVVTI